MGKCRKIIGQILIKLFIAGIFILNPVSYTHLDVYKRQVRELSQAHQERLLFFLRRLAQTVREVSGTPYFIDIPGQKPLDFTFLNVTQYGTSAVVSQEASFSALLERFFGERDRIDRMRCLLYTSIAGDIDHDQVFIHLCEFTNHSILRVRQT